MHDSYKLHIKTNIEYNKIKFLPKGNELNIIQFLLYKFLISRL